MQPANCPNCGKAFPVGNSSSTSAIRFCPYCGQSTAATSMPSALAERLQNEKKPKKKYAIIQEALAQSPDDFEANKALLYHGRLHEPLTTRHAVDFSIVKCHLFSVFHTPEAYTPDQLDAKLSELLRGEQLRRVMALAPDGGQFFLEYLGRLAFEYVDLFIRSDSKYSRIAFGMGRTPESTARKCAEPVRDMLDAIRQSDHLSDEDRPLLLAAVRNGYARVFSGYEHFLSEA